MDRRNFLARTRAALSGGRTSWVTVPSGFVAGVPALLETAPAETPDAPCPSTRRALRADLSPRADPTPLDAAEIRHLLRRAGFGPPPDLGVLTTFLTAERAADGLLDDVWLAPVEAPTRAAEWLNRPLYHGDDPVRRQAESELYFRAWYWIALHWVRMAHDPGPALRERMVLFWMNHFVVSADKVFYPQALYRYIDAFRRNPWGNFRQLVKDVTVAPAMLIYLDGVDSPADDPNENYARELLELFTLGVSDREGTPNYTEQDVKAFARALTGWTLDETATTPVVLPARYVDEHHASAPTTPFGAPPANYGLAAGGGPVVDVIDLLFERKGATIARYLCEKLYRYFVYARTDGPAERGVIDEMAALLQESDWELKPVLRRLLTSAHFYDPANVGVLIKSPLDFLLGLMHGLDVPMSTEGVAGSVYYLASFEGQTLLMPPNVKGWIGYRRWLSTTTLPLRNVVVSTNLLIGGQVGNVVDDGNGNLLEPLLFSDETLLDWARRFDNFAGDIAMFFIEMIDVLCARRPSERVLRNILAKLPPNAYEWPALPDKEKIPTMRLLLNEIALLAEYQLT